MAVVVTGFPLPVPLLPVTAQPTHGAIVKTVAAITQNCNFSLAIESHTQFLLNCPIFPKLLQVRLVFKIRHLGIVMAVLFTGRKPFLSYNKKCQTEECSEWQCSWHLQLASTGFHDWPQNATIGGMGCLVLQLPVIHNLLITDFS